MGRNRISEFIERLVRPCMIGDDLLVGYRDMAGEGEREEEARVWAEATVGDAADEKR